MSERGEIPDAMVQAAAEGTPPCLQCEVPHSLRYSKGGLRTWADPVDGHIYRPMTVQEFAWFLLREKAPQ